MWPGARDRPGPTARRQLIGGSTRPPVAAPGPLALVGSGEFLDVMRGVDAELLAGRPQRAVVLPTAAAQEGAAVVRHWIDLAVAHYRAMRVEPVPLRVLTRADADDEDLAGWVRGAGLVYLSGGDPGYLAATLRGTKVWAAIVEAWRGGSALAGCSAGAASLTAVAPTVASGFAPGPGLALVPHLVVVPHFDRVAEAGPAFLATLVSGRPAGSLVVGVDEDTALVGGPSRWTVRGRQSVSVLADDGTRRTYRAGDLVDLAPADLAAER